MAAREEEERKKRLSAADATLTGSNVILDRPLHDTGTLWLGIFSFLLPLFGLIAGLIFRKHNYIRNYKMCMKGAIICVSLILAAVILFLIFLGLAHI